MSNIPLGKPGDDWKTIEPLEIKSCTYMKTIKGMKTCPEKCDKCGELAWDIGQEERA